MKDEQLYSYAFGELSDSELQRIEAELMKDPAANKEVELLMDLRSDLKSFQEIPEMQLSTERLREAILGQGLKPAKPSFAWWTWLGGPAAAASVFLLFFAASGGVNRMLGRNPEPQVVLGDQSKKPEPMVAFNTPDSKKIGTFSEIEAEPLKSPVFKFEGSRVGGETVSKKLKSQHIRKKKSPRRNTSSSEMVLVATNNIERTTPSTLRNDSSSKKVEPTKIDAGEKEIPGMDSAAITAPDSTIVMINTERDETTGAPIATEVRNPSNVVIGG